MQHPMDFVLQTLVFFVFNILDLDVFLKLVAH